MLKEELEELQQFARPGLLCGRSEQGDGQVGQEEGDVEAMERKKNTQQREREQTQFQTGTGTEKTKQQKAPKKYIRTAGGQVSGLIVY